MFISGQDLKDNGCMCLPIHTGLWELISFVFHIWPEVVRPGQMRLQWSLRPKPSQMVRQRQVGFAFDIFPCAPISLRNSQGGELAEPRQVLNTPGLTGRTPNKSPEPHPDFLCYHQGCYSPSDVQQLFKLDGPQTGANISHQRAFPHVEGLTVYQSCLFLLYPPPPGLFSMALRNKRCISFLRLL